MSLCSSTWLILLDQQLLIFVEFLSVRFPNFEKKIWRISMYLAISIFLTAYPLLPVYSCFNGRFHQIACRVTKPHSKILSTSPVKSVKLCLLAQVKPLIDPSLYSLKSPTSSAPESSLCHVDPTKNTLGFSFFWSPAPGPSCSTRRSAPVRGQQKIKKNNVTVSPTALTTVFHLHPAACLWSCWGATQWPPPWCLRPAPVPPGEWTWCRCCCPLPARPSSPLWRHLEKNIETPIRGELTRQCLISTKCNLVQGKHIAILTTQYPLPIGYYLLFCSRLNIWLTTKKKKLAHTKRFCSRFHENNS